MLGKTATVSLQGAGALLVALACCAIPVLDSVNAADLALRPAAKTGREAPMPVNGPRGSLYEEFLRWKRGLSR